MENTTTKPYTRILQFIAMGSGCGDCGKNVMMNASTRNSKEKILRGSPKRPSENRDVRSGSPLRRFSVTHDIETMYEESRAPIPRELMMLKATIEPMLMSDSRIARIYEN